MRTYRRTPARVQAVVHDAMMPEHDSGPKWREPLNVERVQRLPAALRFAGRKAVAQAVGYASTASTSIAESLSDVNARPDTAALFCSSWLTDEAPIRAEVIRWSRMTHCVAICASACPRPAARALRSRAWRGVCR